MKRKVKLNPNLRPPHSVTKTDKGKGKNKRKSPFYAGTQLVSKDDLLGASVVEPCSHRAGKRTKMVPSRSLRSRMWGISRGPFSTTGPTDCHTVSSHDRDCHTSSLSAPGPLTPNVTAFFLKHTMRRLLRLGDKAKRRALLLLLFSSETHKLHDPAEKSMAIVLL